MMIEYSIIELKDSFVTLGLNDTTGKEFLINKGNYSNDDIKQVIDYILAYIKSSDIKINNKETISCGSWLIQFIYDNTYIKLYELKDVNSNTGENIFEFDLSITIDLYKRQFELCKLESVEPLIPRINQKIAISNNIYEGAEVNGVRYEAPEHMSGWYLTSNDYNGDINTLSVDYLFYIIKARPELIKFLALPVGFRFYIDSKSSEIWKDEDI
ncbi:hypothetical protein [uncultured Lacinutrix sp.]|uniref:immunity protein Imm33 domain-containing protein n=1 Tax=uncultured Lacinutrix sp. TaxID=574032 RepID=UPI002628D09E|nr:hypothetical protein [uncultured Lacinutrix sp.]